MNIRKIVGKWGKFGAGFGAMVATGAAMAQTSGTAPDFSTGVVATLTGGQTQLAAIGVAVLALCAIVALIAYSRRATR